MRVIYFYLKIIIILMYIYHQKNMSHMHVVLKKNIIKIRREPFQFYFIIHHFLFLEIKLYFQA